ncbi:MAG: AMP-binding protein [Planctomycetota bacterium]|jgi:fatty-acyl-CoA synthase
MHQASTQLSYVHVGGDEPLLWLDVDGMFRRTVARFPDRDAVISLAQGHRLSYLDLDRRVEELARGLLALGVQVGDRVGIWSTDNAEWIVLQLATARIGAVLVNINPAYRTAELRHALKAARVQVLILIPAFRSSQYVEMACDVCPDAARLDPVAFAARPGGSALRRLICYDPDAIEEIERPAPAFLTWAEVVAEGRKVGAEDIEERRHHLDPDDPINIQFTSGTTGFPKPVVLTHHSIVNNGYFVGRILRLGPDDRLCVPVPFYHCFGMVVSNLACLVHGAAIVIPAPHFEADATLAAIQDERCTVLHGVPTMFVAELERPDFGGYDLSSLRTGIMGGAPCPPELVRRVTEEMGCKEILIGYGQTEASPITHLTRPDDSFERRSETVGTNLPHQEVKLIDPNTGATVPLGEPGEVCFRGYHVMRGYFEQPAATQNVVDEAGWLHSGDVGVLDPDGYLRITGRLKEMIIRGGENVYPAEIEAFYCEHPKVAQVAVFGVKDPRMGEEVGAWIKLHEGVDADPEEFREHAKGRIAHYKIPRYVWIVDDFPMTVTGKIQKFRIREIVAEWMKEGAPTGVTG